MDFCEYGQADIKAFVADQRNMLKAMNPNNDTATAMLFAVLLDAFMEYTEMRIMAYHEWVSGNPEKNTREHPGEVYFG